ncbi:hypothetical protein YC2023_115733 [Brassica napus]
MALSNTNTELPDIIGVVILIKTTSTDLSQTTQRIMSNIHINGSIHCEPTSPKVRHVGWVWSQRSFLPPTLIPNLLEVSTFSPPSLFETCGWKNSLILTTLYM